MVYRINLKISDKQNQEYSVDQDQTPSDQGLHYLPLIKKY